MKPIIMLVTSWCPYCKQALQWMNELKQEHSEYQSLNVTIIDEEAEPAKASQYSYYYVPTYFVGNNKLHEGVPSKDIILKVFAAAIE